jgi:carbamoyltransferase
VPFTATPAVLADHAAHWFNLDAPSVHALAPPVHERNADKIPAVVHVDRTARVQTVDPKDARTSPP